jgi:outer membrane protein TolC
MAIALIVVLPMPGAAQHRGRNNSSADAGNPLDAVVQDALRRNLGLAQARLLEEAAAERVREARGRYLPSLTIDSRYSDQSGTLDIGDFVNPVYGALNELTGTDRFPTDLSITFPFRHDSRIRLVQPVFNESIRAGWAASKHLYRSQRSQRLADARTLAADAQTAFLNVAAARALRRTWTSTLVRVEEAERVAQRLVDAGTGTPDAVFRARAERTDVEQRLREAEERERAAQRSFNRLMDRPLDQVVDTVPEESLLFPLALTEDEAVLAALANREELQSIEAASAASQEGERAATAAFLPSVTVALDYGFQGRKLEFGRDHDFWTASVLLSWNVFNGGQDAARRRIAQVDTRRLSLQREDAEDLIRLDARQAWQAARVARDAIDTANDRVDAARRTFQLVRRRYDEGLAAPIEFLDARSALTNAELNRVVTVYQYAIRWVDLERAAALRAIATTEEPR